MSDFGFSRTVYTGAVILPYLSVPRMSRFGSFAEAGSFVKLPVDIKGTLPSWR
jgi:hypothetical protein